ncbi:MAG: 50S ribosomal protein L25 [Dehalococcoidia bacterium]|nr:50S ribosomal protein L25 [Dehalococcoidia bacterium]
MDVATVKLDPRTVTGKKVRQLRRQGVIPVHLYGADIEPSNLQIEGRALNRLLPQVGTNIPISVEVEDQKMENICFVREVQRHPVTEEVLHVDFLRVDVTRTVSAEVPLTLSGISPAVSQMAGTLLQNIQTLSIEALPMNMPAEIPVDISVLVDFDTTLLVGDIEVPGNVTVLNDPEDTLVRVAPPRLEVETFDDEELEEGEGEEGAEGADEDASEDES